MRRLPRYCIALIATLIASMIGIGVAYAASNDENGFASRINGERAQRGLSTLRWDEDLAVVARRHSRRMADSGNLHHNPNLRYEVDGWEIVGENVGFGPNVDALHQAFMDSSSHRANILDRDYTLVGTGTVWKDDTLWVTEVFMKPQRTSSAAARPATRPASRPRSSSRPAARPRSTPAPPRPSVTIPPASPALAPAAPVPAYLTQLMVQNLLGGEDPAAGAIHAADLFVSPADVREGGYVGVSFGPFSRLARKVSQDLISRTAAPK